MRECLDIIPHATQGILDLDISKLLVGMRLDLLQKFALCRQNLFERLLEIRLRGGRVATGLYCNEPRVRNMTFGLGDLIAYRRQKDEPVEQLLVVCVLYTTTHCFLSLPWQPVELWKLIVRSMP